MLGKFKIRTLITLGLALAPMANADVPLWGDERAIVTTDPSIFPTSNIQDDYSHVVPRTETILEKPTPSPTPIPKPTPPPMMMSIQGSRASKNMVLWDMCNRKAVIRATKSGSCGDERIHPVMVRYLEAYMLSCSQKAAAVAGYSRPAKLLLNISGAYAYRTINGSSRMSQHATGRALDIYDISLLDANGKSTAKVSMHIRKNKGPALKFYNSFRTCWAAHLRCDYVDGSIGHRNSHGHKNGAHDDHLHLQADPNCRGPK